MDSPPAIEDQARLLEDALVMVRQQTHHMRKCLETPGKLMDALKCSSTLVSELRTSSLGPKQYYELYMSVFDALRHLSVYLRDSHPVNHLADLYELVQYAGNIVPRLYLMITVVITQVFPDEFHLNTLDELLSAIARLNPHVNIKAIVIGLMDRLSSYAAREAESESPEDRKQTEEEAINRLIEKLRISKEKKQTDTKPGGVDDQQTNGDQVNGDKPGEAPSEESPSQPKKDTKPDPATQEDDLPPSKKSRGIPENVKLYEIFYEQVINLVNAQRLHIQDTIALLVSLSNLALADLHSATTQSHILALLLSPIKSYVSLFTALALPNFVPLLHAQTYPTRRAVAGEVVKSILRNQTKISSPEHLDGVLEILQVLIKEGMQQPTGYPSVPSQRRGAETEETVIEQGWLARLVHLIQSPDNDVQFKLLQTTRKSFSEGNERIKYTTPALLTSSLKLARKYKSREHYDDNWQSQSSALYKFMHSSISALYTRNGAADLCLRLFIACGQVADQAGFEEVAYEFFAQAFTIYEEAISDSRAQFQALYRDGKRVLECLQRALRVADACMDTAVSVELFVEILNRYVYYFDQQNETVTTKYINGLIELIHSNLQTNQESSSLEAPKKHFQRTLEYISSNEYEGVVTQAK
ncbi:vacuolar protein sorting-associated protein 35, partial [Lecanoromycetidae sp. Uapishka_2]